MSQSFHTYSVEWDEHSIKWKVDGNTKWEKSRFYDNNGIVQTLCGSLNVYWWMDRIFPADDTPMWIITNLAVRDNPTANFPVQMEIDYIRFYQKINSNNTVNITSRDDIFGSTVAGQEVVVNGSSSNPVVIYDDEFLNIVARDNITIDSDFEAREGAIFTMRIEN